MPTSLWQRCPTFIRLPCSVIKPNVLRVRPRIGHFKLSGARILQYKTHFRAFQLRPAVLWRMSKRMETPANNRLSRQNALPEVHTRHVRMMSPQSSSMTCLDQCIFWAVLKPRLVQRGFPEQVRPIRFQNQLILEDFRITKKNYTGLDIFFDA